MLRASFSSLEGSFINIDDYESKDNFFDLSEKGAQNTQTDSATAIRRIHDGLTYELSQSIHGAGFTELTSKKKESSSIINSLPENDSNSCCLLNDELDHNSIRRDSSLWWNYPINLNKEEQFYENDEVEIDTGSYPQIPKPFGSSSKRSSAVCKNKVRRSSQSSMLRASFSSLVESFINIDDYESKDKTFDLSENEEFCVKNLNKARRASLLRASFISLGEFSVDSQLSQ